MKILDKIPGIIRHCETTRKNATCHYLTIGCTGCGAKGFTVDEKAQNLSRLRRGVEEIACLSPGGFDIFKEKYEKDVIEFLMPYGDRGPYVPRLQAWLYLLMCDGHNPLQAINIVKDAMQRLEKMSKGWNV